MCKLTDRFNIKDISWKVLTCNWNAGKPYALITPFVNATAVQNRLDDVCSFDGWQTEYVMTNSYVNCKMSIWSDKRGEWITKENTCEVSLKESSDNSPDNPYKTACSGAFKRVAFDFGIGRYLKNIKYFAKNICETPADRSLYIECNDKKSNKKFYALRPTEEEMNQILSSLEELPKDEKNPPKIEKELPETKKDNSPKLSKESFKTLNDWINQKCKTPDVLIADIKKCFGIPGLSDLTENQLQLLKDYAFKMKEVEKAYKTGGK